MEQELIKFIREYLSKGSSKEEIKSVLMKVGGWASEEVEKAFVMAMAGEGFKINTLTNTNNDTLLTSKIVNVGNRLEIPKFEEKTTPIVKEVSKTTNYSGNTPSPQGIISSDNFSKEDNNKIVVEPNVKPVASVFQTENIKPQTSPNIKTILISVFVLFFILITGGLAYYFLGSSNDAIFWKSIENDSNIKSGNYSGNLRLELLGNFDKSVVEDISGFLGQGGNLEQGEDKVSGNLIISLSNRGYLNLEGNFESSLDISVDGSSSGLRFGASLSADSKIIGDVVYFNLKTAPEIGFDLGPIKNQWIMVDQKDALGQAGIDQQKIDEEAEKINEIYYKFKESGAIYVEEKHSDEEVLGVLAHHFSLGYNKEKLIEFLNELVIDYGSEYEEFNKDELDEMLRELEESNFDINIDVWIGKKDGNIYKIVLDGSSELKSEGVENGKLNFVLTFEFSDFGEIKEVLPPDSSKSIEEVISEMMMVMMGGISGLNGEFGEGDARARDTKRIEDLRDLKIGLNLYYDTNAKYPSSLNELSPNFLSEIPLDPVGSNYFYELDQETSSFKLCANLEETMMEECVFSEKKEKVVND